MSNVKAFLKEHRLVAFFVIAYALSWYPWILALMQERTTGPNPLGPLVAGILVTAIVYGNRDWANFSAGWCVGGLELNGMWLP
jgi:hypothetical protein